MVLNDILSFILVSIAGAVIGILVRDTWTSRQELYDWVRGARKNHQLGGVWYEYHVTREHQQAFWIEYRSTWTVGRLGAITEEACAGEDRPTYRGTITPEGTDLVFRLSNTDMPEREVMGRLHDTIRPLVKRGIMVFATYDNDVCVSPFVVAKNKPLDDTQLAEFSAELAGSFLTGSPLIKRIDDTRPTILRRGATLPLNTSALSA